jgi:hypothetical protein
VNQHGLNPETTRHRGRVLSGGATISNQGVTMKVHSSTRSNLPDGICHRLTRNINKLLRITRQSHSSRIQWWAKGSPINQP